MKITNLLEFLNEASDLQTLSYAECDGTLVNFLDLLPLDEQFMQKIDFGLIFVQYRSLQQCVIVDGLGRILSLSLLLHAICECYKKTTKKNDDAIKTIRSKYLLNGTKTKLTLNEEEQIIYNKIIFGERLSGKEKRSPIFRLLHSFWTQIKEEKLQASVIFKLLNRIYVTQIDIGSVQPRDLYYSLNKNNREINQLLLIDDYMKSIGLRKEWDSIKQIYNFYELG